MARAKKIQYVVLGFNTENYKPTEIATVSNYYDTYEEALEVLKECAEEDGIDLSRLNEENGEISTADGHRGYCITTIQHGHHYLEKATEQVYTIVDRYQSDWKKTFKSATECKAWLMEGLMACEGAERDHYVDMLTEFMSGNTTLHYN